MNEIDFERDRQRIRKEVLTRRVLDLLRQTTRTEEFYFEFTDESARVIAPLIEAVDILESIIWASDGCMGHRHCVHSMEPWQRARSLLMPKWEAECDPDLTWPTLAPSRGEAQNQE